MENNSKKILYGFSTNGSILNDEMIEFFKNRHLAFSISLDGEENIQNYLRPFKSGKGSFNTIIQNMKKLKENKIKFAIEATYTPFHIMKNISLLNLVTFLNLFSNTIKIQPVFVINQKEFQLNEVQLYEKLKTYLIEFIGVVITKLTELDYFENNYIYENFLFRVIYKLLFRYKKETISDKYICNIINNITIFPNGNIYPCYLFNKNNYLIANIQDLSNNKFNEIYDILYEKMKIENLSKQINKDLNYKRYIGDICAGDIFFDENHPALSPHIDYYYKMLISLTSNMLYSLLKKDKEKFEVLKKNVYKTYENTIKFLTKAEVK